MVLKLKNHLVPIKLYPLPSKYPAHWARSFRLTLPNYCSTPGGRTQMKKVPFYFEGTSPLQIDRMDFPDLGILCYNSK